MLRINVDTNIIVSGRNFPGNPRRLLAAAESGALQLCVSPAILEEVSDVLQRKKFGWSAEEAQEAVGWISQISDVVSPSQPVALVDRDPDDNRILECALAARSDYIVTGETGGAEFEEIAVRSRFGYSATIAATGSRVSLEASCADVGNRTTSDRVEMAITR